MSREVHRGHPETSSGVGRARDRATVGSGGAAAWQRLAAAVATVSASHSRDCATANGLIPTVLALALIAVFVDLKVFVL